MAKTKSEQHTKLGKAILALVAGLARPVGINEIMEMLSTQGFNEDEVHQRAQAMVVTGRLKLGPGLKIELRQAVKNRIRADVDRAREEVGRANKLIEAAQKRRVAAIASLIEMSARDLR